jgi:hypothetical protein
LPGLTGNFAGAIPVAERSAGRGSNTFMGKTFTELGILQEKVVK